MQLGLSAGCQAAQENRMNGDGKTHERRTEPPRSGLAEFVAELRRRKLGPFLIAYTAFAWVLLQLGEIVMPAFGLGDGALRLLVIGIALLFPPAAALAWLFDLTRQGFRRTVTVAQYSAAPRIALVLTSLLVAGGAGLWLHANGMLAGEDGDEPISLAAYPPEEPITSVAVLPLRDNSEDASLAHIGAGMHDEIIMYLGQVDGLRVVSRSSVERYAGEDASAPQIGKELGVEALIEGSVNRSDTLLRATLRLVHAPSDTQMDAFTIDTTGMDALSFQSFVAATTADRVDAALRPESELASRARDGPPIGRTAPGGGQADPAAVEAYLTGLQAFDREDGESLAAAASHFEEAIRLDSSFAPAFTGLAVTRIALALEDGLLDSAEAIASYEDASQALTMAPYSTEARDIFSLVSRAAGRRQPELGEREEPAEPLRISIGDGEPTTVDISALDTVLIGGATRLGRSLAARLVARGSSVGSGDDDSSRPSSVDTELREALWLIGNGEFVRAADNLRSFVRADGKTSDRAWQFLINTVASAGDPDDLAETIVDWSESGASEAPGVNEAVEIASAVAAAGLKAFWSWQAGRLKEADSLAEKPSRTELARAHAGAGLSGEALDYLSQALAAGEPQIFTILNDPVWDGLRRDDRFIEIARLVRELRFSPAIRADGDLRPGGSPRGGRRPARGPGPGGPEPTEPH